MKYHSLKQRFEPYLDILIFMVTLIVANFLWKGTFNGDENGQVVTWLGWDVTAPFLWMSRHVAAVVFWLLSLCRDTVHMIGDFAIRFDSGVGTKIIWGCSGLKQAFIWMCLILTVRGGWKQKLWYIPLGWVVCYLFNILRIFLLMLLVEYHGTWFHFLHDYFFKYLFYAVMFGLWYLFVEKIRPDVSTHSRSSKS